MGGGSGRVLPSGTVTFLFTDIEGSTKLLTELGDERYEAALAEHRHVLRKAFVAHGGHELGTEGDSFFVVFATAAEALAAALTGQLDLQVSDGRSVRVRMGLHTGDAHLADGQYVGLSVHHAARVSAAAHGGQVLVSQTTHDVAGSLPPGASLADLGEHRLKDLAQPTRLYNLVHPGLQAELPPPRTLSVLPNNLPLQLTTFIGRDKEIAEVAALLESSRLVSLVGAGGSGKTRLALQVAADVAADQPNGVWLVDLAPITDPDLVFRSFAEALGVRDETGRPIEDSLIAFLQNKSLVVVLDNCEHLATKSAEVVDRLLHACAGLRVIATSREPLGADGETVFRVPSLDVPTGEDADDSITAAESVRLFCDRASHSSTGFALTPDNVKAVATICRRLDGLPLAIELAAARVRMLTPHEIADRLDDRFGLLTRGARTIPRQQTLRAAVDWSHALLSEAEQVLFRRLSVFVGGFTLKAVEGICSDEQINPAEILDLLSALVDRSLVVAEPSAEKTRYRLLETMREYGREALLASGEADALWSSHLAWFADLAERGYDGFRGKDEPLWLETFDAELDNIRQALAWGTSSGDRADAVRLASYLTDYWCTRWYVAEAYRWVVAALETSKDLPDPALALGLSAAGALAFYLDKPEECRSYAEACVAMERTPQTMRWIADATDGLGSIALQLERDVEKARDYVEQALKLRREIGNESDIANSLSNLATVTGGWMGDRKRARALRQEALDIYRRLGFQTQIAYQLNYLAEMAGADGDVEAWERLHSESLEISRRAGDNHESASTLLELAGIADVQSDYDRAKALIAEALNLFRTCDDQDGESEALARLGSVEIALGRYAQARELIEQALASRASHSTRALEAYLVRLEYVEGNLERAHALTEESTEAWRSVPGTRPGWLTQSARIEPARGNFDEAARLANEALRVFSQQDRPNAIADVQRTLGLVDLSLGDLASARIRLSYALRNRHQLRVKAMVANLLDDFARLLAAEDSTERAAQLFGSAEAIRESTGDVIHPVYRAEYDDAVARARDALGDDAFRAEWSKGKAMPTDEAVALALEEP